MNTDPLVVVHQPDFIPYLGFFHRLLLADVWVVLDSVQFPRRGWVHRDLIKTQSGTKWISIPLVADHRESLISQKKISHAEDWRCKHLNQLRAAYGKAPFFHEIFCHCEALYATAPERLMDFTMASIDMLLRLFDISIPRRFSSEMNIHKSSNELMAALVVSLGGHRYLSGPGARNYYDPRPYEEAGVTVEWQVFEHPVYPQLHGAFTPMLSSLDLLFNCGVEQSRKIVRSTVRRDPSDGGAA